MSGAFVRVLVLSAALAAGCLGAAANASALTVDGSQTARLDFYIDPATYPLVSTYSYRIQSLGLTIDPAGPISLGEGVTYQYFLGSGQAVTNPISATNSTGAAGFGASLSIPSPDVLLTPLTSTSLYVLVDAPAGTTFDLLGGTAWITFLDQFGTPVFGRATGVPNDSLVAVSTVSAVPLPAALPLLGSGLAAMGLAGWRRRRRAAAA